MNLSGQSSQAGDQSSQLDYKFYANADYIGVNLQPVKIKHMANHS